jgi:hypothetical protein
MTDDWILLWGQKSWLSASGSLLLGAAGLVALGVCRRRVSQTTLTAAWNWAVASLLAVAALEIWLATGSSIDAGWTAHARYAVAITTLAPQMAVLGAKRPQHRAWQFIVGSLLLVLALPAVGSVMRGGDALSIAGPWRWFLAVLIVVGWANYAATRFWPSSFLLAAGQWSLLSAHLPWPADEPPAIRPIWGVALAVAAAAWVAADVPRARNRSDPINGLWLDFRDTLGSLWCLRVAERFNATARAQDWPLRLTWRGVEWTVAEPDAASVAAAKRSLRMLLRRFVSPRWISQRLISGGKTELPEAPGTAN